MTSASADFPFVGNGKAIALGEDQGLVKVIFDKKTGALLGAHMVGAEVTELIQGYVVAMNLRDHRGGADPHRLPASDAVGNDEGGGARRLRARAEHLRKLNARGARMRAERVAHRRRNNLRYCIQ